MTLNGSEEHKPIFRYRFNFKDGAVKQFEVELDPVTLHIVPAAVRKQPEWARLERFQCEHCPLDPEQYEFCPVALNLFELVENFKNAVSCDEVDLCIETSRRGYVKHTAVQNALSSLMGIYMATSGCPVFEPLKPMVRYHLPFAGPEETAYRMISMYVTAQYFMDKHGKVPDWRLERFPAMLKAINAANCNVCAQLRKIVSNDALLNAVIILNSAVDFMALCFDEVILAAIERDFTSYLK